MLAIKNRVKCSFRRTMFETSTTQVPHKLGKKPFLPKVCGTNVVQVSKESAIRVLFNLYSAIKKEDDLVD